MDVTKAKELHNAATVIIISDEVPPRTLLIKHRKLKSWLPPGGHQDLELPNETAIREVREETRIDITKSLTESQRIDDMATSIPLPALILLEEIPAFGDKPAHLHQDLIYRVRIPYQEPVIAENEHDGIAWFREDELEDLEMIENAKQLVLDAFTFFSSSDKTQE